MTGILDGEVLTVTSVTERSEFRQCRRKWFLSTVKRLQQPGGAPYFWFGNLGHYALEHYYLGEVEGFPLDDREEYAREAFEHFKEESFEKLQEELGFLWESAKDEYGASVELCRSMLEGYFLEERETGGLGDVLEVETRYRVPIVTEKGRAFPKAELTGRFDLVTSKKGDVCIIDHKFLGSKHSSSYLDLDDQLTGYAYLWFRATGVLPRWLIYNVLLKKAPAPPRQLKDGRLSVARDQATTASLFLKEIKRLGLDRRDYDEHLVWLQSKGWTDFYVQEGVFRNMAQLEQFELNLAKEWRDMRDVAAHPDKAYPTPSSFNCPSCPVRLICATMQDGGDVEAILDGFVIGEERR